MGHHQCAQRCSVSCLQKLTATWENEREEMKKLQAIKAEIDRVNLEVQNAEREYDLNRAAELKYGVLVALQKQLKQAEEALTEQVGRAPSQACCLLQTSAGEGVLDDLVMGSAQLAPRLAQMNPLGWLRLRCSSQTDSTSAMPRLRTSVLRDCRRTGCGCSARR